MLKAIAAIFVLSGPLLTTASVEREAGVHINSGKLLLDEREIGGNVSLVQSHFKFLFMYVPGTGLITISDREFDGSQRGGAFKAGVLDVSFAGHNLRLESASPILGPAEVDAWVSFDPSFTLDTKGMMFGYGDDLKVPQDWRKYVHSN